MSKGPLILAIDQGTTSSRAVIFDAELQVVASAQQEFQQFFPHSGWVEHDADEIWDSVVAVCRAAIDSAGIDATDIAGIGITNQRETTVVWDRATGKPISRAIVWQDRRTASVCRDLTGKGHGPLVERETGLRLDPYFSATKIAWLLDHTEGARDRAAKGELAFGTIDSFVLWRLTGGQVHATDITNASRTALYDIHSQRWSQSLLDVFDVPESVLPEVRDCAADFGSTDPELFGAPIAICGIAGDQQAALIGQACFEPGMTKSTYGTGCFVIANTGDSAIQSQHQLLTTIGYRIGGKTTFAVEGSIFVAGSAIQWLRDALRVISHAGESAEIASAHGVERDVIVVPAFTGLGAPHWDPDARGAIFGLTRGSDRAALVTATLQSIAYQTADLMGALDEDGVDTGVLRVDGGMVANEWFLQFLADVTRLPIERPVNTESTVLGAAGLAGLQAGLFDSLDALSKVRSVDRECEPTMPDEDASALMAGWHDAVRRTRSAG
ncbi:MAG: glycerol kinase GlpK [Pseudomonadota bacterium]